MYADDEEPKGRISSSNARPGSDSWKEELEEEADKRRELKDQVRHLDKEMLNVQGVTEKLRWTTVQMTDALSKEAEEIT